MPITLSAVRDPDAARAILDSLPDWFGIPEANDGYVRDVSDEGLKCLFAHDGERPVGVALVRRHFPESAELHLLAVSADAHRCGVGSALVERVAADLTADGASFLTVHTVGPSLDHEPYRKTRAFYTAMGFVPLEEHQRLDWDGPTIIMVRPLDTPA